ncbi:hypothetical protein BuS5_00618 [Desulfosarcina sp. BuS5]|uniref:type IV pilus modification PilV family protein n=1 Tax=Desulfosarcina sp. BuS5 TaxID=933262 RepID=UPI0006864257|nr:prepilin-type N-terminal cleavage/methylation domain-containing protein [Desulfosarcina sp. BuS5]WDN87650.1 hypothetical protein BuS5_00618 [Desulfosarcina sp. BuS5]
MNKKIKKNQSGFTLIEVLIGMTVFAIGILGVAAMQLSAIKGNSYSSHLSEASTISQDKIEELILLNYDDHVLFDDDGDDDDYNDGNGTGGLDHTNEHGGTPDETNQSKGVTGVQYTTSCNIAVNQPIQNTKTIRIITTWTEKGATRTVTMDYIKFDEI